MRSTQEARLKKLKQTKRLFENGIIETKVLAVAIGVTERTMCKYLTDLGIAKGAKKAEVYNERYRYVEANLNSTIADLCAALGLSKVRVYDYIRDVEYKTGKKRIAPERKFNGSPVRKLSRPQLSESERMQYKTAGRAHKLFTARLSV